MTTRSVEMVVGADGTGCRAVHLTAEVGVAPAVTLDLTPRRIRMEIQGNAAVDEETHELLVKLGWSAPAGDVEDQAVEDRA